MYITVVESKDEIRKRLLRIRRSLSREKVLEMSREIKERLFDLPEYRSCKVIMFYIAHDNEVETREMIIDSLNNKKVLVPYTSLESDMIYPVEIENLDDLEKCAFGILEPQNKKIYRGDIDVIIVPGIAFDLRGYRIGYGKGFYDRFLRGANALKIGIAYDFQIVDRISEDKNDVPVDMIVSEKRVLLCRKI